MLGRFQAHKAGRTTLTCHRPKMPHVTGPRLTSQQAQETRNKKQDSRNRARKPWGRLQALKPGRTTLNFLHHRTFASPRNFGEMFPVLCESLWLSFGILATLVGSTKFRPLVPCLVPLCYAYLLYFILLTYGPTCHMSHVTCHCPRAYAPGF